MIKLPKDIEYIITDFDGVMTDGFIYIPNNSSNFIKRLNFKDIMAISIAQKHGYNVGIISGEKCTAIDYISQKFHLSEVHTNIRQKIDVIKDLIARMNINPQKILEIGTAIGYSGTIILLSCDGNLVTLEKDNASAQIAQETFKKFNLQKRVTLINCDAIDYLINCKEKFDFVFLDGPKGQYIKYYPYIKKILNTGGILFADNVLFRGLVKQPTYERKYRSLVNHLKEFNNTLLEDKDFDTLIKEIGDGVLIAKKR